MKVVAAPEQESWRFSLYDRERDPGEGRDVARAQTETLRPMRRELELFWERGEREKAAIRNLLSQEKPKSPCMEPEVCENLKSLGYVSSATRCDAPCR